MEKLAALVPPPRSHLVRYHGVLGPSHEWREAGVPPEAEGAGGGKECGEDREIERWEGEDEEAPWGGRKRRRKEQAWATRIRRSLGLDALRCPGCG